jgi:pimeloyl-ACP methyl ester carboxylesterase
MTIETRPADKTVTLNGLDFHYLDWDNDGAQTLLLLHGYTSHAHTWDTFAAAVAGRFHVLALDQRGHGQTAWAKDYAPERMIEDVDAFVTALGLRKFVLLGLSMGGRNAYGYAAAHPAEVARLVIVDIGPEIPASGSDRIRNGVLAGDVFDDPEQAYQQARAGNARAPGPELRHRVMHNLVQMPDGRWTFRYDKALRAPDRPLPRPSPETGWKQLSSIACPTLLVRGAESDVLAPATAARMVREMANCRLVEVPEAGHSVPLDNPPGFLAAVSSFLG